MPTHRPHRGAGSGRRLGNPTTETQVIVNPTHPPQAPPVSRPSRARRLALLAIPLSAALGMFSPRLHAGTLMLDFTDNGFAPGWIPVYGTHLGNTMVNEADVGGSGFDFKFDHVACYNSGNVGQPLTRSGFYNYGRLANTHDFTLSGLPAGRQVKLYSCAAWDDNPAGGYVVFGDNAPAGVKAQTIGNPGTAPTLANLTYIGMAVADGNGAVTGSLHGRNGVDTDSEGQVGGFVFVPDQVVVASSGANGSISPAGEVTVGGGESQEFTITANSGYHVADVLVDGVSVGAVTTHTFDDIGADHTISASFAPDTTVYTIHASAGTNGSITPAGAVSANEGVNKPFTITPEPGYHVTDVLVDGVPVGAVTSHTFFNVMANHSISASFAINTYLIDVTAGDHGTISPAGTSVMNHGDSADFTFTPDPGYYVSEVLVDGVSVGMDSTFTFPEVTADHTISVSFDNRTRLYLDFTSAGGTWTTGWTPVFANWVSNTPLASVSDIEGLGYDFSFTNVGSYDNGQSWESFTRSGFYTVGNNTQDHIFTLTGLNAGQTVALYASSAWDGDAAGGYVVFGDNAPDGVKATTVSPPGTNPTLGHLTLIGTAVSDATGTVTGSLHGRNGVGTVDEGQVGGFLFAITPGGTPAVNPFRDWATSPPNNLTGDDALEGADPDFDGVPNLLEFALNGSPISGASTGLSAGMLATVEGEEGVLTLTIAVREDAVFSANGNRMKSARVDGVTYIIEAATNLGDWGVPAVTEVTGTDAETIQSDLVAPDAGWTYKTFRTAGDSTTNSKGFIRVEVE